MHYLQLLQLRRMSAADGTARNGGIRLQLFAGEPTEPNEGGGNDNDPPAPEPKGDEKPAEKMLPQSEVNRIVQETIAKERKKAEEARTEAEKLAKMTEQQRMQHEADKREAELTKREAELTRRELRAQAAQTLAEKNLPICLLEVLDYANADACSKSIDATRAAWNLAVQAGVEERLKGKPPKAGGGPNADDGAAALRKAMGLPTDKT